MRRRTRRRHPCGRLLRSTAFGFSGEGFDFEEALHETHVELEDHNAEAIAPATTIRCTYKPCSEPSAIQDTQQSRRFLFLFFGLLLPFNSWVSSNNRVGGNVLDPRNGLDGPEFAAADKNNGGKLDLLRDSEFHQRSRLTMDIRSGVCPSVEERSAAGLRRAARRNRGAGRFAPTKPVPPHGRPSNQSGSRQAACRPRYIALAARTPLKQLCPNCAHRLCTCSRGPIR